MIIPFYWLMLWLYLGLALLRRWQGKIQLSDIVWALPLGTAVSGGAALLLWMVGIDFRVIASWVEVGLVTVLTATLISFRHFHFPSLNRKNIAARLGGLINREVSWPLAVLGLVALFSAVILVTWQVAVEPVSWDALTLYDFRARRVAEGWTPIEFMQQFSDAPGFAMYDFLHPMFSSILSAFVYKSGGSHPAIISMALLVCVLAAAWKTFRSIEAKTVFFVFFLGSPVFFTAGVEGYGIWTAVLFWILAFLFLWGQNITTNWEQGMLGFFILAASQSRLSEPYWLIFCIWLFAKRKWLSVLPAVIAFVSWQTLVQQAAKYSSAGVVRSTYAVGQSWAQVSRDLFHLNFWPVIEVFLFHNPSLPYVAMLALAVFAFRRYRHLERKFFWWLSVAFVWMIVLLAGMLFLFVSNPSVWPEISQALPRASLPLSALCLVLLAAVVDRLRQENHLIH